MGSLPPAPVPRAMTLAEKILARHVVGARGPVFVKPGDAVCVRVDGGYSHEFTTAQVHHFLEQEYGAGYRLANPAKFAVFEDHLIYADGVARMAPFAAKIETLRSAAARVPAAHRGPGLLGAGRGLARHLPQRRARAASSSPATSSRRRTATPAWAGPTAPWPTASGPPSTRPSASRASPSWRSPSPSGSSSWAPCPRAATAKDVMLHILAHHAKQQITLDRVMEFGGRASRSLSPDERATLANMATECSAKAGIVECDEATLDWIAARRPGGDREDASRARSWLPIPGADYAGGVHVIDLGADPADGRDPGRSGPGHPLRSDERRLRRRPRRGARSTSPTAARARRARKPTSTSTRR